MAKRNRMAAALIVALIVLAILALSIFIIGCADHNCAGDGCEICEEILFCTSLLKTLFLFAAAICISVIVRYRFAYAQNRCVAAFLFPTPVSLRVKLSN